MPGKEASPTPPADAGKTPRAEKRATRKPAAPPPGPPPQPPSERKAVTGRTLYDTIVEAFDFVREKPVVAVSVTTGLAVLALILTLAVKDEPIRADWGILAFRLGKATPTPSPPAVAAGTDEATHPELRKCFDAARKEDLPYVIEAVTYFVRFEPGKAESEDGWHASHRLVYTLRARKKIDENDGTFIEKIEKSLGIPERWYGSEKEANVPDENKYYVKFNMEEGDTRTVVTGANFFFPDRPPKTPGYDAPPEMNENQMFESYHNEQDVICELTMIIDAKSLMIEPMYATRRKGGDEAKSETKSDATLRPDDKSPDGPRIITSQWRNILPNEIAGIYIKWPPKAWPPKAR